MKLPRKSILHVKYLETMIRKNNFSENEQNRPVLLIFN